MYYQWTWSTRRKTSRFLGKNYGINFVFFFNSKQAMPLCTFAISYPTCKTNYERNSSTVNTRKFLNVQMCTARKEKFVKPLCLLRRKRVCHVEKITLCAGRERRRVFYGQLGKNNNIDCTQMSTGQRKIMVLYFVLPSVERIDNTDKHIVIIIGYRESYWLKPYERGYKPHAGVHLLLKYAL